MSLPKTSHFLVLLVLSFALRLYVSVLIYSGDLNNHFEWGESIIDVGASGAYSRYYPTVMQPTYPPFALYAFATSSLAFRAVNSSALFLNSRVPAFPSSLVWALEDQDAMPAFQKIIAILSDLGIGVLLYAFARRLLPQRPVFALVVSALYLLNPAVWYVSSIWGQIDSFPLMFIILAFYLAFRRHSYWSVLSFACALLSKQTSALFAPIFAIYWFSRFSWKQMFLPGISSFALFYLSYLPFSSSPNLLWPFQIYLDRLQTGSGSDYITDHAFNFWALFTHLAKISDSAKIFSSMTYSQAGYILFALFALPFLVAFWRKPLLKPLFHTATIFGLAAFLFLPRMHERYLVPALPFMLLSALNSRWFLFLYVLLSLGHLANLYHNWWYPNIPTAINLLSSWMSIQAIIFAFLLVFLLLISVFKKTYEK